MCMACECEEYYDYLLDDDDERDTCEGYGQQTKLEKQILDSMLP